MIRGQLKASPATKAAASKAVTVAAAAFEHTSQHDVIQLSALQRNVNFCEECSNLFKDWPVKSILNGHLKDTYSLKREREIRGIEHR